ncbi:hypothetical protein Tco_0261066 [Tanacetum coccineum]
MELQIMCQIDVLHKRPHDDHNFNHHEGECAKRQKTIKESSVQETSSNHQQDDAYFGSGNDDIVDADMYDDELTEVITWLMMIFESKLSILTQPHQTKIDISGNSRQGTLHHGYQEKAQVQMPDDENRWVHWSKSTQEGKSLQAAS